MASLERRMVSDGLKKTSEQGDTEAKGCWRILSGICCAGEREHIHTIASHFEVCVLPFDSL